MLESLERLDPALFDLTLIAGRAGEREGDLRDLRPSQGPDVVSVETLQREISPVADLRALFTLVRLFRRLRPDVVHTHLAKAGALGRLAARLTGVHAVVHTYHGNVFTGYFGPRASRVVMALERLLASISTRVIAISETQRADLVARRIARAPRLVTIPIGIDLDPFMTAEPGALRRELGLPAGAPLVGCVTRLVPIKGVDVLLRAAARLDGTHVVVVGDGPLEAELKGLAASLGVAPRVTFLGLRPDVAAIYADLDVVVLPSRNEGTPLAVIEALASARAVVASRVGGIPDVVGDAGVLVPPDDVDALAAALAALLAGPERRRELGRMARERVQGRYDISLHVARMSELYRGLAR